MRRIPHAVEEPNPGATPMLPGSVLPPTYTPKAAGYARGPFLDVDQVTPTSFKWMRARTFLVKTKDGQRYRALRVFVGPRKNERRDFVGYWAIELLGTPLPLPEWEED